MNKTHGMKNSREYVAWNNMRSRCNNPKNKAFRYYGERGIKVKFKNFEDFFTYIGNCPNGMSLDRIDNDGDYEKGNVRWTTKHIQMSNRSDNRSITYNGKTQTLAQWSREKNISISCLWARIEAHGWTISKALNTPLQSPTDVGKQGAKRRWR